MQESRIDEEAIRRALKAKRSLLFADFVKDASNIRLALEIRYLDDRISDRDGALGAKMPGHPSCAASVAPKPY